MRITLLALTALALTAAIVASHTAAAEERFQQRSASGSAQHQASGGTERGLQGRGRSRQNILPTLPGITETLLGNCNHRGQVNSDGSYTPQAMDCSNDPTGPIN